MTKTDVYLYGQILGTHSFLLEDGFLRPDQYSEISGHFFLPGGETGTAATVLASLGVSVRMDGTKIGPGAAPMLRRFYENKTVDLSSLSFDEQQEDVIDYVVIAGLTRSPMGRFRHLHESTVPYWNPPREADILNCHAAAIDPFFGEDSERAAKLCVKHGVPYVTIDCRHDRYLHQHAAVNVVSKECLENDYPCRTAYEVMPLLQETADGLVIITSGGGDMLYARRSRPVRRMKPFPVTVKSTLGAGDTFKAGCVYGLLKGFDDDRLVRFASACAGIAISRFPLPLYPPRLEEVQRLILEGGKAT